MLSFLEKYDAVKHEDVCKGIESITISVDKNDYENLCRDISIHLPNVEIAVQEDGNILHVNIVIEE